MNFSISEIMVVLLVALLVIKPDQLPDAAFTLGRFVQSIRRMFVKVKEEVNGLMDTTDLKPAEKLPSVEPKYETISHPSEEAVKTETVERLAEQVREKP